jgi:hypothetical protein
MKLFVKLMLAAVVIALLLPFTVLKDDQGKTLMSFSDFSLQDISLPDISIPDMSDLLNSRKLLPSNTRSDGKDIFYRWNDAQGNVHFTTEPPPDGIEYTVKGYDPKANVIQPVKIPTEPDPLESAPNATDSGTDGSTPSVDSAYNPGNVKKLINDTKNIEKILNQRYENQNSAIN